MTEAIMNNIAARYRKHLGFLVLFVMTGAFFYITLVMPNLASSQTTRYYIDNSLQLNSASSRSLSKVFTQVGSTTKWTFSAWVKRDSIGTVQPIFTAGVNSSNYIGVFVEDANRYWIRGAGYGGAVDKRSTATYTSTSAWNHIVVAVDTSQGTADNRSRMYIDGVEVTSFAINTNLSSNAQTAVASSSSAVTHYIGASPAGNYFDGLIADAILVDGMQLTPSYFGYDDGGTWRPKEFTGATTTGSGFTTNGPFGTDGFWLDFSSANALGEDRSGRRNNFVTNNVGSAQQSATTPTGSLNRSSANNFKPSGETYFTGDVVINGGASIDYNLSKGAGSFVIDHPLDPKNKLLYHSFVESPDMKNIYDGVAQLDEQGRATIQLPGYFLALNKDFRYLATAMGEPMPNLYLSTEVRREWFGIFGTPILEIAGGAPGGKVSWQVTGTRHDLFAQEHPIRVEVEKGPDELVDKGELLHPHAFK